MIAPPSLLGIVRAFRVVILLLAAAATVFCAAAARSTRDDDLASLSGRALVKHLEDPATRARAFHELSKRANERCTGVFEDFAKSHRNIELVVCPQGPGRSPLYLLLYDFLPEPVFSERDAYPTERPEELFPSAPDTAPRATRSPAIEVYTAAGRLIAPFKGNDVLDGILADINRDGLIERVETTSYGVDGIETAEVLHVWAVEAEARSLFSVLINWGAREWTHRLRDQDGDGVSEIEIGPDSDGAFTPEVVFVWDKRARAYRGPAGRESDHFRVLTPDSDQTEAALKSLRAAGLVFPAKSPAASSAPAAPAPASYAPRDWARLPDEELFRLMGSGPNAYDRELDSVVKSQLPTDFWKLAPKAAALAFAELNRSEDHRRRFRLALDDRDGAAPPASGSLSLTSGSSRCYVASDAHYFLRYSPEESYLAYARSASGGAVFYNVVSDRPSIDLRLCPVSYETARHLAAILWWLDRVRSREARPDSGRLGGSSFSTADGFAELVLRNEAGKPLLEKSGTRWAAELSERWTGHYAPEAFLNFADWLVCDALTQHLGEAWTRGAPPPAPIPAMRREPGPLYSPDQLEQIHALALRFISLAEATPPRISPAVASVAAEAAGDLALADAEPALRRLLASLPAEAAEPTSPGATKIDWPKVLHQTSAEALRKIETGQDLDALERWAAARQPGGQWALRQLAERDPARYARLLETWLHAAERPREGRQIFQELTRVARPRALVLSRALPPEKRRALVPPELLLEAAPDETQAVAELTAVLLDRASGWQQRREAIDALVPEERPLRFPQAEVDAALLRALEPDMADDTVNFTCVAACEALALRGRTEHFERIGELFRTGRDRYIADDLLKPLVLLAQTDPERLKPRLAALLGPHLVSTNGRMSEMLWALWSADLREFKSRLEQLVTAGPEQVEDERAVTSGGEISPVKGPFHLARKIADLWNARDALDRARLLAAFSLRHIHDLGPPRLARLRTELAACARELGPDQRARLEKSFDALLALEAKTEHPGAEKMRATLSELFRATLAATPAP